MTDHSKRMDQNVILAKKLITSPSPQKEIGTRFFLMSLHEISLNSYFITSLKKLIKNLNAFNIMVS